MALGDGLQDGLAIALLGAVELVTAVDDADLVVVGQRQRVLDGSIAGADDDDGLVAIGVGVVELVLHQLQILALAAQLAQIALQADRQHHPLCGDGLAAGGIEQKAIRRGADADDRGAVADLDAQSLGAIVPGLEHGLALAGGERGYRAQRQYRRLGHYLLALLVAVNGVGKMRLGFQQ